MDAIPIDAILEYHDDTLKTLRKQYNFEKKEDMNAAVDAFVEWLKKQNHFIKTEYPREYLERLIILNKGSLERAKTHMDKLCMLRTLLPTFFEQCDVRTECAPYLDGSFIHAFLPKLSSDHHRVYVSKMNGGKFNADMFMRIYKMSILLSEYIKAHDYCDGMINIVDLRNINIMDLIKELNLVDFRQLITIVMEGYGFRVKGIHMLTSSATIDMLTKIMKQIFSAKIGNRIFVHRNVESLSEIVSKDVLPAEYGGTEKPLKTIYENWLYVLSTKEFMEHVKLMNQARTNEKLRLDDTIRNQYMGIAGTFRTLSVD